MPTRNRFDTGPSNAGAKVTLTTLLATLFGKHPSQQAQPESHHQQAEPDPGQLPPAESVLLDMQFKITMKFVSWKRVVVTVDVIDKTLAKRIGQKTLQTEQFDWYSHVPMDKLRILQFVIDRLRSFRNTLVPGYTTGQDATGFNSKFVPSRPHQDIKVSSVVAPAATAIIVPTTPTQSVPASADYVHPTYGKATQSVSGRILSMGTETVTRPGRGRGADTSASQSYETYVVRVEDSVGEVTELQGVALAQCVAETQVQIGDTVTIHKFRQQKVLGNDAGSYAKNQFVIQITNVQDDA